MSQDRLPLSSQCERQPSHLEVTEWDLCEPALDILAVVFYTCTRTKRPGRRSAKGGWRCCSEKEKEFWPEPGAFYGSSERTSLDNALADQAPAAVGYLWFPSRGRLRARTCIKRQLLCIQTLAHTHTHTGLLICVYQP